jgi:hypothetical protein
VTALDEGRRSRETGRGSTDVTDLLVGLFLALFLPIGTYLVAQVVIAGGSQSSIVDRPEKVLDPPPDAEELSLRQKAAEERVRGTAKAILRHAESLQDPFMKEEFRKLANVSLGQADAYLVELEKFIRKYPDRDGRYAGYLSNIATLRKEVQGDQERAKKLDFLGVDSRR